ncbi:MAG: ECF transporter S component [Promethearchaeota archaeon]|nr:MAG: ECF transporter S component [Candidatus Lokiarchaeota archaeon]
MKTSHSFNVRYLPWLMIKMSVDEKNSNFMGYFLLNNIIVLPIAAIFAAVTCVLTFIVPFTIPSTQGYINLGDIGVMISGLLFGPIVGGIAGGFGSALTDMFLAPQYAIPTLIIKGLEGFVVGLISDPRKNYSKLNIKDFFAVIIGGILMILGYFIAEIILYGFPSALVELFFNGAVQFGLSAVVSLLFIGFARKPITTNLIQAFDKIYIIEEREEISD